MNFGYIVLFVCCIFSIILLVCHFILTVASSHLYILIIGTPQGIHRLNVADRIRYTNLVQSSATENRYFVRIMIVGKESVGKTCLMRRLLKDSTADVSSTDGVDIVVRRCKINIQDGNWTIEKGRLYIRLSK